MAGANFVGRQYPLSAREELRQFVVNWQLVF
jgi:hypothetical protein